MWVEWIEEILKYEWSGVEWTDLRALKALHWSMIVYSCSPPMSPHPIPLVTPVFLFLFLYSYSSLCLHYQLHRMHMSSHLLVLAWNSSYTQCMSMLMDDSTPHLQWRSTVPWESSTLPDPAAVLPLLLTAPVPLSINAVAEIQHSAVQYSRLRDAVVE